MEVSENGATPKWLVHNGKTIYKWMIWGYPYLIACGKPAGHSHLVHRDILYEPSA
jgi:hypothetical protein